MINDETLYQTTHHRICSTIQESQEAKLIAKGLLLGDLGYITMHVSFLESIAKKNLTWGTLLPTTIEEVKHIRAHKYECLKERAEKKRKGLW